MSIASADGLRVLRLKLNTHNAVRLAHFYETALGFRLVSRENLSGACREGCSPVSGRALRVTLQLGAQQVELLQFLDRPGRPYPYGTLASDLVFQHFAIVVSDMDEAMNQLRMVSDWTAITVEGPQRLPSSSGGVTAFKFRDPDGHPLELLMFPADAIPKPWQGRAGTSPCLGVDHTAISVSDSSQSIAFYEDLGLSVSNRSLNDDPTQALLDHVDQPVVEVTAMSPHVSPPHLELLCYRSAPAQAPMDLHANDVAATCVVWGAGDGQRSVRRTGQAHMRHLQDPDGHHLSIELA